MPSRLLSLDYGKINIGLACCDDLGVTVRPLPSMRFLSRRDFVSRLRSMIQENDIHGLVLGIPLNMNGSAGESVRQAERFAALLQKEFDLPLKRVDERLSTVEAADLWREMSPRQKRRYRTIDSLSAALILERYLREN